MVIAYLDTNVFIFAFKKEQTNSKRIVELSILSAFIPAVSFHTFDELKLFLSAHYSRDSANNAIHFIKKMPSLRVVEKKEIDEAMKTYANLVSDIDDLPHICACMLLKCDFFVTTNRKLTQMKAKDKIQFVSPKRFVELLGLPSLNTQNNE